MFTKKLQKMTNSFSISVHLSASLQATTQPSLHRYVWNSKFGIFSRIC